MSTDTDLETSENRQNSDRKPGSLLSEAWDWIKSVAVAIFVVTLLHLFVFNLSTVNGHSMEPTLQDGEWLFVNKIGYLIGKPHRGDIVILKDPSDTSEKPQYLVKRIVGMPGETIEVHDKHVYINGKRKIENYTDVEVQDGDFGPVEVPKDHFFIMGDNRHRSASKDSRMFGVVSDNSIEGKAEFIMWPIPDWSSL